MKDRAVSSIRIGRDVQVLVYTCYGQRESQHPRQVGGVLEEAEEAANLSIRNYTKCLVYFSTVTSPSCAPGRGRV
jgi:hypothetical protein